MIGSLQGTVAAVGEESALIEVGGVGYVVQASGRTLGRLGVGANTRLYIETHVREDAIRLFGFDSEEERAWFAHLQTIPGVGAKVALGILDAMPPTVLIDAIALQDKAAFARANGVGPKLAARLAQELAAKQGPKGFISLGAVAAPARANGGAPIVNGARAEAVSALVNLGIDQSSAARAVASAAKQFDTDAPAPELIRAALKEVSR
ncbi:MAG TPA: Holliday junction branch migration protein RuvA [Candidatus Binatia bacterium]|nr:Holliday junction branch migration protein RuvA [Candidatus Binatia bacterium]